jgi:hypothetical protein
MAEAALGLGQSVWMYIRHLENDSSGCNGWFSPNNTYTKHWGLVLSHFSRRELSILKGEAAAGLITDVNDDLRFKWGTMHELVNRNGQAGYRNDYYTATKYLESLHLDYIGQANSEDIQVLGARLSLSI